MDQCTIVKKELGGESLQRRAAGRHRNGVGGQRNQWLGRVWRRSEDDVNRVVLERKAAGKDLEDDREKGG